jgi:hypothetical protein
MDVARLRAAARTAPHRGRPDRGQRGRGRHAARDADAPPPIVTVVATVVAAGALLGGAVVAGIRWADATAGPDPVRVRAVEPADPGRADPGRADPERADPERADTDWAAVLRRLDQRRSAAFARGDVEALDRIYVSGSAALRRDAATLGALVRRGLTASRLRMDVRAAVLRSTTGGRVVLEVVDRMPAYDLVDRAARVVGTQPGRGDRTWTVTLVAEAGARGEWRIAAITPGPG